LSSSVEQQHDLIQGMSNCT